MQNLFKKWYRKRLDYELANLNMQVYEQTEKLLQCEFAVECCKRNVVEIAELSNRGNAQSRAMQLRDQLLAEKVALSKACQEEISCRSRLLRLNCKIRIIKSKLKQLH